MNIKENCSASQISVIELSALETRQTYPLYLDQTYMNLKVKFPLGIRSCVSTPMLSQTTQYQLYKNSQSLKKC